MSGENGNFGYETIFLLTMDYLEFSVVLSVCSVSMGCWKVSAPTLGGATEGLFSRGAEARVQDRTQTFEKVEERRNSCHQIKSSSPQWQAIALSWRFPTKMADISWGLLSFIPVLWLFPSLCFVSRLLAFLSELIIAVTGALVLALCCHFVVASLENPHFLR